MGLPDQWSTCSRTILLQGQPTSFAHCGDIIGLGMESNVVLLDAITGNRTSVLSGHTETISSLEFSQGGALLLSRSYGEAVKLWDVQTGGVIRTFSDNTSVVLAASISPDGTTVALGTNDGTIRLWDVRTGQCHSIETGQDNLVKLIRFSPADSRRLISSSFDGTIQQWDVGGHQIGPSYQEGGLRDLAYASDGARFVSCAGWVATVRDSESAAVVIQLDVPDRTLLRRCCFSPEGTFVACATADTIYVWDVVISGARLVGRLTGHSNHITSIAFPSSLISASQDPSIKFWQSSSFLADSKTTDHMATLHGSTPIKSVNLFSKDATVVTTDEFGTVKTWDLMTGRCKSSCSTPAKGERDTHLAGGTLILVWWAYKEERYHIWDVSKGQLLRKVCSSCGGVRDVKISGDGSRIFGLCANYIEALHTQTGEVAGRVATTTSQMYRLFVRGSKVGVHNPCRRGWDFGGLEVSEFGEFPNPPRLDLIDWSTGRDGTAPSAERVMRWIGDTVTGRPVFHLPERYIKPDTEIIWDGRYLLIWSRSGEVVIMDFERPVQTFPTAFSFSSAFHGLAAFLS